MFIDENKPEQQELEPRYNYNRQIAKEYIAERNERDKKMVQAQSQAIDFMRTLISNGVQCRIDINQHMIEFTFSGTVHAKAAFSIANKAGYARQYFSSEWGKVILDWSE